MTRNDDVLERLAPLSGAPSRGYEDLLRLQAKRQRAQKIGVLAVVTALLVALVGVGLAIEDRSEKPADQPDRSQAGMFAGMVIRYTGGDVYEGGGNLVAQNTSTGEEITVLECCDSADLSQYGIGWAAPSADGGWVAFQELAQCTDAAAGLWVTNGTDEPRLLTTRCLEDPAMVDVNSWSPTGSQLAVVEGGRLILINAATGGRTDLGKPAGDVTSLAWSPDGSRIAYGTVPAGTGDEAANRVQASVYSVDVRSADHALLANVIGEVPGGEEGSGIRWSPDGRRIAVLGGINDARLYLVKADGSGAELLTEGVLIAHSLSSPNLVWSPDGTRIAYATLIRDRDRLRIWNGSPDGTTPVLVFDPTSSPGKGTLSGAPVWSPDGTQIAFRYDSKDERVWLVANADGTGDVHKLDELQPLSWRGGWYFCECYG